MVKKGQDGQIDQHPYPDERDQQCGITQERNRISYGPCRAIVDMLRPMNNRKSPH